MRRRISSNPSAQFGILRCLGLALLLVLAVIGGTARAQTEDLQASTPPTTAAVPSDTASSTYELKPYDLIDVDVFNESDLHKPARLGADGTVLLPLIGSLKLGGLTVSEATDLVTKKYGAGFVKNPSVLITVLQYRKSTFSILGQVARPGVYEIPEGANISIVEAVSLAGGYGQNAAQNSITIKRTVDGKQQTLHVRAGDMAQNPDVVPFQVLPDDAILVSASAYQNNSYSILGQVQRPGLYTIPDGAHMTIIEAISTAGGFSATAGQNDISVKRKVNGGLTILKVKAREMVQDPNVPAFEIQPGDSILVPFRTSTFSILGQVDRPGIYEVEEGTHLTIVDAILMAGGYTRLASQNSVTVKRTVNGKIATLKVRARDMAEDPKVTPFEVLPGDIVKVNESWY